MTLLEQYSGYENWYNAIDDEVARDSTCEKCGHFGLEFHGFKLRDCRFAVADCPQCHNQFEF